MNDGHLSIFESKCIHHQSNWHWKCMQIKKFIEYRQPNQTKPNRTISVISVFSESTVTSCKWNGFGGIVSLFKPTSHSIPNDKKKGKQLRCTSHVHRFRFYCCCWLFVISCRFINSDAFLNASVNSIVAPDQKESQEQFVISIFPSPSLAEWSEQGIRCLAAIGLLCWLARQITSFCCCYCCCCCAVILNRNKAHNITCLACTSIECEKRCAK